jgi:hypothetical protein
MSFDPTVPQGGQERRHSLEMSLQRAHPPTQVSGYEPERFLGGGAYGEVWVAIEKNTGRRVAIKFYAHRGGLDWSLLSREVEKLAFLFADRYVVQLIGVGWEADPPYYIMEYLERGSLAERIQAGPIPVAEAVELFRDVAIGLVHAHGKGVLHCDLKPANILLDQDQKPRLADFGQSRLSHEQAPALGTLFYMAPEQADLKAQPDARWDVYALGALLYCMLTGSPPHRTAEAAEQLEKAEDLDQRLAFYRRLIRHSPPPTAHRQIAGVDRVLAEIVDRCLAVDPARRYPNVQAVLAALDARNAQRARRPMMVLGAVGPALLLAVVALFAWRGFSAAVERSERALTARALETNHFAAQYVARTAANELERRFEAVEQVASSERFRDAIIETINQPEIQGLLKTLSDPNLTEEQLDPLREQFRQHPARKRLQREFESIPAVAARAAKKEAGVEGVASWFFCEANGVSTIRVPESLTLGKDFAWRSFFHEGNTEKPRSWRPQPSERLRETKPSDVFLSQASDHWIVAIATPVWDGSPEKTFLGVVALTVEVGRFMELQGDGEQFATLVDWREGKHKGMVLQHPLFRQLHAELGKVPDRFQEYRVTPDDLPNTPERTQRFYDPLGDDPKGQKYDRHWLAQMQPVVVRGKDSGWIIIVQEAYDKAIGATLAELRAELVHFGVGAALMIVLVMLGLWVLALRLLRETGPLPQQSTPSAATERAPGGVTPSAPTETFDGGGSRQ